MNPAYVNKPFSYRLAIGSSLGLIASWLSYLAYLNTTTITKQSVYMGPITFYAALLLAISGLSVTMLMCSVGHLLHIHHPQARRATIWGLSALVVAAAIFAITRPMVNGAI
jgi:hypothetical protein